MPKGRGLTKKKGLPPVNPGPKKCSPLAKSKKAGRTCLPPDVQARLKKSKSCKADDGRCMITSSDLNEKEKKSLITAYFRPKQPDTWKADPHTWLNSDDIEAVMKQYEAAYTHFKFLGVVPIDFSAKDPYDKTTEKCMNEEFCKVDLKSDRASGKTVIGAIYNLDPHFKGGSHWVGLVIDLRVNKVCYFDSYGIKPPQQIARYMRYLTLQEPKLILESNGHRFQRSDTECGMYSMYFIICMIEGVNFSKFCKNPIPDKWMYEFRKVLFDESAH
jgi:hypothetical protein